MNFSKLSLLAIGAVALTNMSVSAALLKETTTIIKTPILCPPIQEINCSPCSTEGWSCAAKKNGSTWQTKTCRQRFPSAPKLKLKAAVSNLFEPLPYCKYEAYFTSEETEIPVIVEFTNTQVTKTNCTVNRQNTGFECTISP